MGVVGVERAVESGEGEGGGGLDAHVRQVLADFPPSAGYDQLFIKEAITNFEILRELSKADLKSLGIPMGHCVAILKNVAQIERSLKMSTATATTTPGPVVSPGRKEEGKDAPTFAQTPAAIADNSGGSYSPIGIGASNTNNTTNNNPQKQNSSESLEGNYGTIKADPVLIQKTKAALGGRNFFFFWVLLYPLIFPYLILELSPKQAPPRDEGGTQLGKMPARARKNSNNLDPSDLVLGEKLGSGNFG